MKIFKKKILLSLILLLFLGGLVLGILYLNDVADYKQAVEEITFEEVNKDFYKGCFFENSKVEYR